ncbi:MarR family transcriptional regulator [Novosphingobium sp. 1949]|uniref:MarR family transcriptional regulator n=1 Tax=Novosphingobium organovorum TaxID=2930092 RepID=A0ABT0BA88_9SPHN|nr:MarR family transcriptional regulator [Novosphingobium organovorum]MCJ2181785.1 MarR family transcriptional regulator [Novosphingobium organovorum]
MKVGSDLAGQLGFQVQMLQPAAHEAARAALAHLDISPARATALLLIRANPGCTQSALGAALNVNRSSAMKIVDQFEGRGLIRRAPSADPRAHALELTEAGEAFTRQLDEALAEHETRFFSVLSVAERKALLGMLQRLRGGAG